jgi:hypothetical protein
VALPSTPTGRALLGARIALGISTLLAPRLAGRAFLLDPDANPQLPVIGRMWGIRNLSLAAGMYAATGANRPQWWRLQPAVDALDFLAITTEWRRGAVPGPGGRIDGSHGPGRDHARSPVRRRRVTATRSRTHAAQLLIARRDSEANG